MVPAGQVFKMSSRNILRNASKLASYNISLQVLFRVLTFLVNAFTLWFVSNEMKACYSSLTLLYSTLVFLSREAFRKACLSRASGSGHNWRQVINLLWFILVPLGMVWASLLVYVWLYFLDVPVAALSREPIPHYGPAVQIYAWAAVLELLAEPFWLLSQAHMFVKLKVIAESLAMIAKCILTIVLVVSAPNWGLYIFAAAQFVYSGILVLCYAAYFRRFLGSDEADKYFPVHNTRDLLPWRNNRDPLIDRTMARLTLSFFWQSFLKQILTEGERYLTLTKVLSLDDQGVYHTITNLGSMVARIIFQPIGENFYVFFAKVLERGRDARNQKREEVASAAEVLECLLKLMLVIGLIITVFGWSYSHLALDMYGGSELSGGEGPTLLRCYSFYVLLIAINGVTECFVFAAMSHKEVDWYNPVMLGLSGTFLVLSYALAWGAGSFGFILANCLNMGLRVLYSLVYIRRYFQQSQWRPLRGLRPSPALLIVLAASVVVTAISEGICCDGGWLWRTAHIGVGAVCLLMVLLTVLFTEHKLIHFVRTQLLPHSRKKLM